MTKKILKQDTSAKIDLGLVGKLTCECGSQTAKELPTMKREYGEYVDFDISCPECKKEYAGTICLDCCYIDPMSFHLKETDMRKYKSISGQKLFEKLGKPMSYYESCYPVRTKYEKLARRLGKKHKMEIHAEDIGYCPCAEFTQKGKSFQVLEFKNGAIWIPYNVPLGKLLRQPGCYFQEGILFDIDDDAHKVIEANKNKFWRPHSNEEPIDEEFLKRVGVKVLFSHGKLSWCGSGIRSWMEIFELQKIERFPDEFSPLWDGICQTGDMTTSSRLVLGESKGAVVVLDDLIRHSDIKILRWKDHRKRPYDKVTNLFTHKVSIQGGK